VDNSDRVVASLANSRAQISRAIDLLGATTETVGRARRAARDLRRAPAALTSARGFLAELRQNDRAARADGTAAPRDRAVGQHDARPPRPVHGGREAGAGAAAERSAPGCGALGDQTTSRSRGCCRRWPTRANPSRTTCARRRTLDGSVDNIIAVLQNWARAIQFQRRHEPQSSAARVVRTRLYDRITSNSAARRAPRASTPRGRTRPPPRRPRRPRPPPDAAERRPIQLKKPIDDLAKEAAAAWHRAGPAQQAAARPTKSSTSSGAMMAKRPIRRRDQPLPRATSPARLADLRRVPRRPLPRHAAVQRRLPTADYKKVYVSVPTSATCSPRRGPRRRACASARCGASTSTTAGRPRVRCRLNPGTRLPRTRPSRSAPTACSAHATSS